MSRGGDTGKPGQEGFRSLYRALERERAVFREKESLQKGTLPTLATVLWISGFNAKGETIFLMAKRKSLRHREGKVPPVRSNGTALPGGGENPAISSFRRENGRGTHDRRWLGGEDSAAI